MWTDRERRVIDKLNILHKALDGNNIDLYLDGEYSTTGWAVDDVECEIDLYVDCMRAASDLYRVQALKDYAEIVHYEKLYTEDYVVKLKRIKFDSKHIYCPFQEIEHWSKEFFEEWNKE